MARQQWIWGTWGNSRRDETVVRICKQAVTFDPSYAEAWALMALAQAELRFWHGKDEDPLPAAEKAMELNPDLAEPYCVKVRDLEQQGRHDEADRQLGEALRRGSESWEVNREAARLMFRRDKMGDAIRYFERAAELMDSDFHSCSMLITCYDGIGDQNAALDAARRTLKRAETAAGKDPANGAALAAGASSLMMLGEIERGKDWVQRALLLDPENLWVMYNAACGLTFRNADLEGAMDLLEQFFARLDSLAFLRHAAIDPDLDALRELPRFKTMVSDAHERLQLS
jgi:adenylate cyclase